MHKYYLYQQLIFDLVKSGIKIVHSKNIKHDKTAVITGSFENYSREELKNNLELIGYKITNSVTKKTSILICGEKPGSKLTKAKGLKVKIVMKNILLSFSQNLINSNFA